MNTLHRGEGGCDPAAVLQQLAEAGVTAAASPYLPAEFIRVERGLQRLLADVSGGGTAGGWGGKEQRGQR